MLNIGNLDKQIRIEKKVASEPDRYGEKQTTWVTHLAVHANVRHVVPVNTEKVAKTKIQTTAQARIRFRHQPLPIDATMRVVMWVNNALSYWDITAPPIELEDKDGVEILVQLVQ